MRGLVESSSTCALFASGSWVGTQGTLGRTFTASTAYLPWRPPVVLTTGRDPQELRPRSRYALQFYGLRSPPLFAIRCFTGGDPKVNPKGTSEPCFFFATTARTPLAPVLSLWEAVTSGWLSAEIWRVTACWRSDPEVSGGECVGPALAALWRG